MALFSCGCAEMFPGIQPCFQLLRIGSSSSVNSHGSAGSDSAHDLYTFRPALAHSVFRLGRLAELCDVTLESTNISRVHAELHAEKQTDGTGEESWKVQVMDRSSYGWCFCLCALQTLQIIDWYTIKHYFCYRHYYDSHRIEQFLI